MPFEYYGLADGVELTLGPAGCWRFGGAWGQSFLDAHRLGVALRGAQGAGGAGALGHSFS